MSRNHGVATIHAPAPSLEPFNPFADLNQSLSIRRKGSRYRPRIKPVIAPYVERRSEYLKRNGRVECLLVAGIERESGA